MISAAVEPHVEHFTPDNRASVTTDFSTTAKAPGADSRHNPNKRKVLFVTWSRPAAWATFPLPCREQCAICMTYAC
jgi:hypothetical protein